MHRIRPAAGEPRGALVLLHGRATDEHDLQPLIDVLDPERRLVGVTPRGPLELPPGGRHWYSVRRIGYPDPETFHATMAQVGDFLDQLPEQLGVPWERTVIGGFSQGAVMSYALGLGRGRPAPAGVMALSGFIPTVEGFELDLDGHRAVPVTIAHGTFDPVISVEFGREARDRLQGAGLEVSYHESPMAHSIDPRLLGELQAWLAREVSDRADA